MGSQTRIPGSSWPEFGLSVQVAEVSMLSNGLAIHGLRQYIDKAKPCLNSTSLIRRSQAAHAVGTGKQRHKSLGGL